MKRSNSSALRILLLILAVIGLGFILLISLIIMLLQLKEDRNQREYESRPDPEPTQPHFLFHDPERGEIWVPLPDGAVPCSRDYTNTVFRNGLGYYIEDGAITSAIGVDVSSHQQNIDWQQVKDTGIEFAFIRCGLRTYGSGKLMEDDFFRQNMEGARAAGIDIGIYFFSQAITPAEAREEAAMAIELASGYDFDYPIAYDWETVDYDDARTDGLSGDVLTACTVAFCEAIEEAGYTPLIYQNTETILDRIDLSQISGYDLWLAEHGSYSGYCYDYRIWQFTANGHIPGIPGTVDIDLCYRPYAPENAAEDAPEDAPPEP